MILFGKKNKQISQLLLILRQTAATVNKKGNKNTVEVIFSVLNDSEIDFHDLE